MCYPVLLQVGAMALGAYSSIQAGRAENESRQFNAAIAERNAAAVESEQDIVREQAAIERRRLGQRVAAERGDVVARFAAMGADPGFGTPADLIGDINTSYDIDRSIIARNEEQAITRLDKERADYLDAARFGRASGQSAVKASSYTAAGSLLDGAASVSSRWIRPRTETLPTGG